MDGNGNLLQEQVMLNWNERANGNFVAIDNGIVTTVFLDSLGSWRGIREGEITERGFETALAAMEAIDTEKVKFVAPSRRLANAGWREAKNGGLYRHSGASVLSVKQAKSGKWFVAINGSLVEGYWLESEAEARLLADSLLR